MSSMWTSSMNSTPGTSSALWSRVRNIKVVQCHVLHNVFLLVHVTLWHGDILLCFQVEFCTERIRSPHTLHGSRVRLDVNHVAYPDTFLLDCLVDTRVQPQLLRSFATAQCDEQVTDGSAVRA